MLLAKAHETNYDALALSPTIGMLLLACAICAFVMFAMHGDKWRRWWLTTEDPRGIAVFRIVFTFFLICNINGMWEFFEYLYTDEGIFTADVAWNEILPRMTVSALYTLAFFSAGLIHFQSMDVTD